MPSITNRYASRDSTQPCGVKYYILFLAIARSVGLAYVFFTTGINIEYLTYQIYILTTVFYIFLSFYLVGVKKLGILVFKILLPLVYGLNFTAVILLCFLIYWNAFIIKNSIENGDITLGEMYVGDHILHTLPFVNMLIVAFLFGRYTILSSRPHSDENITSYYDLSKPTYSNNHDKILVEKIIHLSPCKKIKLLLYGMYYLLGPCMVIFLYMTIFDIETIYGKMQLAEPINDLVIFIISLSGSVTLFLISLYMVSFKNRLKKKYKHGNRLLNNIK